MAARKARRSGWITALEVTLVVLLGALLGSALAGLGRVLLGDGPVTSTLTRTWTVGLRPPATLDLVVASVTLGVTLEVGLLTLAGIAAAVWLWLRVR